MIVRIDTKITSNTGRCWRDNDAAIRYVDYLIREVLLPRGFSTSSTIGPHNLPKWTSKLSVSKREAKDLLRGGCGDLLLLINHYVYSVTAYDDSTTGDSKLSVSWTVCAN